MRLQRLRPRVRTPRCSEAGQSLLPVLRLRLNAPTALIDVSTIDELRQVSVDGDTLVIGAESQPTT